LSLQYLYKFRTVLLPSPGGRGLGGGKQSGNSGNCNSGNITITCGNLNPRRGDSPVHPGDCCWGKHVRNELKHLGPKDFITGFLVIVVGILVVSFLVIMFKISIYLAIIIGVLLAVVLGIALLGRVIRLILSKKRSKEP
jgi:hypothetical protein